MVNQSPQSPVKVLGTEAVSPSHHHSSFLSLELKGTTMMEDHIHGANRVRTFSKILDCYTSHKYLCWPIGLGFTLILMAALAQARLSLLACNLQAHSSPDSAALDLAILSLAAALLISTDCPPLHITVECPEMIICKYYKATNYTHNNTPGCCWPS